MIDVLKIIDKYYPTNNEQKHILITHGKSVAHKALQICDAHPELNMNREFVYEASMLHDIGICGCYAPGLFCYGVEPYIKHGIIGSEMMRNEGLPSHARVCERHTGTGLPAHHIEMLSLPLPPHIDFCPETMEEKLVCYADKFYSKTHLDVEKTWDETYRSLIRFGGDTAQRFKDWSEIFE